MKILFLNHECSRTGAPFVLLNLLKWIKKEHPEVNFDIFSWNGGGIEKEFDLLTQNHFKQYSQSFYRVHLFVRIFRNLLRTLHLGQKKSNALYDIPFKRIASNNYELIYQNTIVNLEKSIKIKSYCSEKTKLIVHVHELANVVKLACPHLSLLASEVDFFICASNKVKDNLINNYEISPSKCLTIYEFTSTINTSGIEYKPKNSDKIIIGGAGLVQERKGVDLFIKIAHAIKLLPNSIKFEFQWLGNYSEEDMQKYNKLMKELDVQNHVTFLGQSEHPERFFEKIDLFLMTSREDPFPLVCIEAGSYGVPILLFNDATGTQEIIYDLDYLIAPAFDTDELAQKIVALANNQKLYAKSNEIMQKRFSEFNVENQSKKIMEVMMNIHGR